MNNQEIVILSGDTATGKTTQLMVSLSNTGNIDGVFQPVIADKRFCYLISKRELLALETDDMDEEAISVGRFRFRKNTIQKVKEHLRSIVFDKTKTIVIDEWGKMERAGEGFETEISDSISAFRKNQIGKLIIVVRSSLLSEFLVHYKFAEKEYKVVTVTDLRSEYSFP